VAIRKVRYPDHGSGSGSKLRRAKRPSRTTRSTEAAVTMAVGKRNSFDLGQVERGLLELAMSNGDAKAAVRVLEADEEAGFKVSAATLHRWRAREVDRYEAIRAEQRGKLMAVNAEHHLRLSEEAAHVVSRLIKRVDDTAEELPPRDIPGAARNMATVSGIHADKAREASEAPRPPKLRDATEVLRDLAAMGYKPQLLPDDQRGARAVDVIDVAPEADTEATSPG
jgi:hypothetical protein